jgi:hypothetical protein
MLHARRRSDALFAGPVERIVRRGPPAAASTPPRSASSRATAAELRRLEQLVARLTISRRDPERFFIERSELKAGLAALARQFEA